MGVLLRRVRNQGTTGEQNGQPLPLIGSEGGDERGERVNCTGICSARWWGSARLAGIRGELVTRFESTRSHLSIGVGNEVSEFEPVAYPDFIFECLR